MTTVTELSRLYCNVVQSPKDTTKVIYRNVAYIAFYGGQFVTYFALK